VYRIQTSVPTNWIPFQPIKFGTSAVLRRSQLLDPVGSAWLTPQIQGRVLQPGGSGSGYSIRNERIPREGLRVTRRFRRARGVDGTTHVWVARAVEVGTGEGYSGLRFDLALSPAPSDT